MPLRIPPPPEAARLAARRAVTRHMEPEARKRGGVRRETTDPQLAIAIWTVGLPDLLAGSMSAARLIGWQHMVSQVSPGANLVAETVTSDAEEYVEGRVTDAAPFLGKTIGAIETARILAADMDYELRLIVIPALYVLSAWLANPGAGDLDIFIPIDAGELFPAGTAIDAKTWLGVLRPEAERRIGAGNETH